MLDLLAIAVWALLRAAWWLLKLAVACLIWVSPKLGRLVWRAGVRMYVAVRDWSAARRGEAIVLEVLPPQKAIAAAPHDETYERGRALLKGMHL